VVVGVSEMDGARWLLVVGDSGRLGGGGQYVGAAVGWRRGGGHRGRFSCVDEFF
jgi:hypothetical protein